jgi:hypothetical protein
MEIRRSFDNSDVPATLIAAAQDESLSCGARGLLLQILTQGVDRWEANVITLSQRAREVRGTSGEGRDSMRSLLNELRDRGYVHTRRLRTQRGQLGSVMEVYETPQETARTRMATPATDAAEAQVVYLIGEVGSTVGKIGTTTGNLTTRLKGIQTGYPRRLSVLSTHPGGRSLEEFLHDTFQAERLEGEWFDFGAAEPVSAVAEAVERFNVAAHQQAS